MKRVKTQAELKSEEPKVAKLYDLSLAAVPNPGKMAELYLTPHHSAAIDLQARQFAEDRARWQKEHQKKFRFVVYDIPMIKNMCRYFYPSTVIVIARLQREVEKFSTEFYTRKPRV